MAEIKKGEDAQQPQELRFVNHYHCDACDVEWEDEWSCMCDDECPECGVAHTPYQSDELKMNPQAPLEGTDMESNELMAVQEMGRLHHACAWSSVKPVLRRWRNQYMAAYRFTDDSTLRIYFNGDASWDFPKTGEQRWPRWHSCNR